MHDEIRNRVTFGLINLVNPSAGGFLSSIDVIFCRNVMIYFTRETRARVLALFHRKLRPGGFLLLGHSESLLDRVTEFLPVSLGTGGVIYRKGLPG